MNYGKYSKEQVRIWKERDVAESLRVQEEKMSYEKKRDFATMQAEEITRTVYNRTKSAKDSKVLLDKPNMFIIEDETWHYVVYVTIGDKCYRSVGHHICSWENFDQKWKKTNVRILVEFMRADSSLL